MSIKVLYINATGKTDFTVNVYSHKYAKEPWRSIHAQSSAIFHYNGTVEVGASYRENGLNVLAGPFEAEPGSLWKVKQDTPNSTAVLSQGINHFHSNMSLYYYSSQNYFL